MSDHSFFFCPRMELRPAEEGSTILEWLPSEMLCEIATTYRLGTRGLGRQRQCPIDFGYGVARLMAMTCKTMQRAVGHCIQDRDEFTRERLSVEWYVWFATVGDRPLLYAHLVFDSGSATPDIPVGLCRDAGRHWLASNMRLDDRARWIVPTLLDAMVRARCWDRLSLFVQPPASLAQVTDISQVFRASLLVDIPGRPGVEHITDDARLAYVKQEQAPDFFAVLLTAFGRIALTPTEVDGLCRLVLGAGDALGIEDMMRLFAAVLTTSTSLSLVSTAWTCLSLGKRMKDASPGERRYYGTFLWRDLVSSGADAPFYEWLHTSVYPVDATSPYVAAATHCGLVGDLGCVKSPIGLDTRAFLVHLGPTTPLSAVEWMRAHGQTVDFACPVCGFGLFAHTLASGNLPIARWAIANTRHLGIQFRDHRTLVHASGFSTSELERLYTYAMEQATKVGPGSGFLRNFCDWIEVGASMSLTAMNFIIERIVPDPRLSAPGAPLVFVHGPASMLFSAMVGVVLYAASDYAVRLLTSALVAWSRLVTTNVESERRRLRVRLISGVACSEYFSRREKEALIECIAAHLGTSDTRDRVDVVFMK
jgi:hypothetical protein